MCVERKGKLHCVFFYKNANVVYYKGLTLGCKLNLIIFQILHLQMPKCWELGSKFGSGIGILSALNRLKNILNILIAINIFLLKISSPYFLPFLFLLTLEHLLF